MRSQLRFRVSDLYHALAWHDSQTMMRLADQWGYARDGLGATVWTVLACLAAAVPPAHLRGAFEPLRLATRPGVTSPDGAAIRRASAAAASRYAPGSHRSRTPPGACAR